MTGEPARSSLESADAGPSRAGAAAGRAAFAATALFLAQLYLSPAAWFPIIEPLRIPFVLSGLGLSALVVQRMLANRPLWMGWRTAALAIYAGTALASPVWSIDAPKSVEAGVEVAKHFLFFLALVNTATSPGRVRVMFFLYAVAAIVPAVGTFENWRNGELLVDGFRGRWLGVMADPNHDAMSLVAAVPLLLHLALGGVPGEGRSLFVRALGLFGVTACVAGVVATHSRGGSVGLLVAFLTWALLARHKAFSIGAAALAAVGVMLLAPSSFWERNETIAGYQEDASVHGRMQAWQVAGRIAHERPVLGVGAGAFLTAWDEYAPIDAGPNRFVAHNIVLEVLGELGVVGLTGLVLFVLASFWSAWRARRGALSGEASALLAGLVGYLVCQMFSGYSRSWFLFGLCGLITSCEVWGRRPSLARAPARSLPAESFAAQGALR